MNIAQLRAFVCVVERGSFSAAAKELAISQPAVTMQVQALESDLGFTLLDRRYRRTDLTEAGRILLPHARRILGQLGQVRDDLAALSGKVTGPLHIAASTTPGVYVVPAMLGAFNTDFPEVGISVSIYDSAGVTEAVLRGEAHIGITGAMVRGSRAEYQTVFGDELVLITPPGSPLAARKDVLLANLTEERWVCRESGSGTRQVTEAVLADHGVDPAEIAVVVELGTGEAVVSAVEGGLGIAIVSRLVAARAIATGAVSEVPVDGLPARRPFFVVLPKGTPTRAAEAFRGHLVAAVGR